MKLAVGVLLIMAGCASAPPKVEKIDWAAVDAVMREARWRTDRCEEPSSPKCDALWLVREEIDGIIKAARAQFEQEHQAEINRLTTP